MTILRLATCVLTLCLALTAPAHAADEPRKSEAAAKIPILAWGGPPADQTTVERYRELAECGFTHNFSGHPDNGAMAKALDVAQAAGIKLLISTPQLKDDPEATAAQFRDHPANGGYYLRDEPDATLFGELAAWCQRVQKADPAHPCYVNLFPNYATPDQLKAATYQDYLDQFVSKVPTPMLSFDHYPVVGDRLRGEWYDNLERSAATARSSDRPLWAFVLSVAHGPYPTPTIAHLRVQAFSNLAYGAQTIQYFTYWTFVSTEWNFNNGPIDAQGKRTEVFHRVKQVNGEIQQLARVFAGSTVLDVGHTGETLPAGTRRYKPAAPVAAVETEGEGAVVSTLAHGRRRHLVVVNRDINRPMPLTLRFDGSAEVARWGKDGVTTVVGKPILETRVDPGDVFVLSWEATK